MTGLSGRETERAVSAVLAVAGRNGLPTREPRILRDLTNVLVHLAPAPVVARVPLTLALLRPPEWFTLEVRLARSLAGAGAPVAPPSGEVDPGPHPYRGLVVGFWEWIDHDPARFDPVAAGGSLRALHEALAACDTPLPHYDRLEEIDRLLSLLEAGEYASPHDLAGLRQTHRLLADRGAPGESRPVHGDAHFRNVLWSPDGPLWSDLENVCAGPIEYDLACLTWRRLPETDAALAAYGSYDAALVRRLEPYVALFLAAWTIAVVARAPSEEGRAESRRRIARAAAYAREM